MVGSRLNILRALFRSLIVFLQISENHGLLRCFVTAKVLGIVSSAMSFKMEVNKDMGVISIIHDRMVQVSAA